MGKNILIISTSLRKNSNSDALTEAFLAGAEEAGHLVEKVNLIEKNIAFCMGCLKCLNSHRCVIHDYADSIVQKMRKVDVIVFATPIYYYEMCGHMKTLLDRANPLYSSDYSFRDVYILTTAAEDDSYVSKNAENRLKGWIECFPKAVLKGSLFVGGVDLEGAIANNPNLSKAYEMGKKV